MTALWRKCLDRLEGELSLQQFNTWVRPLQAVENASSIQLLAPNHFVRDWVSQNYSDRIREVLTDLGAPSEFHVTVKVGTRAGNEAPKADAPRKRTATYAMRAPTIRRASDGQDPPQGCDRNSPSTISWKGNRTSLPARHRCKWALILATPTTPFSSTAA